MNDKQFNEMTAAVAAMLPHRNADAEIARLKTIIAPSEEPDPDNKCATIESNVWGWTILWPEVGFSDTILYRRKSKDAPLDVFSILSESLETLEDAVKVCDAIGFPYKVSDIQDPDPL